MLLLKRENRQNTDCGRQPEATEVTQHEYCPVQSYKFSKTHSLTSFGRDKYKNSRQDIQNHSMYKKQSTMTTNKPSENISSGPIMSSFHKPLLYKTEEG